MAVLNVFSKDEHHNTLCTYWGQLPIQWGHDVSPSATVGKMKNKKTELPGGFQ